MVIIKETLKKIFPIFFNYELNSKFIEEKNLDFDFHSYEIFLKELSPFYFNETNQYDEETMNILIKLKKSHYEKD